MAAIDRRFALATALCTGIAGTSLRVSAADYPYQQWVCRPADGGWECREEAATPGRYPQPERMPVAPIVPTAPAAAQPTTTPRGGVAAEGATPEDTARANLAAADGGTAAGWDWVPAARLTEEQRCGLGPGCAGAYVEPPRDWPDADRDSDQVPMRASAGSSEWRGDTVILEGGVQVTQGNRKVVADRGELDRARNRAVLEGNVQVREPGLLLTGSHADLDTESGLGEIQNARILDYASGARAEAAQLSRPAEHLAILDDARYTQCTPDDEVWSLSSGNIRLNNESGRGEARHAVLRLGPVPVAYSPWLSFPIDDRRQSGWLWPSLSSSDGGDISAPYYLNLAPNYDATLTPRFIGDRGAMLETELRHLAEFGETRLAGAWLPDDDLEQEDRWLFSGQHQGRIGNHVGTQVDYTKVSDHDYFRDLSVGSLDIRRQTHLNQAARLNLSAGNWSSHLLAQQYQTIDEFTSDPYKRLPQWTIKRNSSQRNFRLDYTLLAEYTDFDHDESIDKGGNYVTGERLYSEAGLTLPMHWAAGYIQPTVQMRYVGYRLDDLPAGPNSTLTDDRPSAATPQAILDAGLFFERDAHWFGSAYRQTLEPRLYYLWSEYEDQSDQPLFDTSRLTFSYQQLFRSSRFSGYDRLEDFNQVSLGFTNRWISRDDGRERLTASFGQIFYLDDRDVHTSTRVGAVPPDDNRRDRSEFAAELRLQPSDNFWATASTLWDTDSDLVNEGGFYLHYAANAGPEAAGGLGGVFNLGYRYRRAQPGINRLTQDLEQADISAVIPLNLRWSMFARFNYDLEDNRSLEDMFGVQYDDCCWMARVVYQRAVEGEELLNSGVREVVRDHAIIFEFQLKGLGSLGSTAAGLLEESILGYRERD